MNKPRVLPVLVPLLLGTFGWVLLQRQDARHAATPRAPGGQTQLPAERVDQLEEKVFVEFSDWIDAFRSAPAAAGTLVTRGIELARARRPVMLGLITNDPREALRRAIPLDRLESLPPAVRAEVEEPFSELAHVRVLSVCTLNSTDPVARPNADVVRVTEVAESAAMPSYVFGRRLALDTKESTPVQGIRLGRTAALRDEVFQTLEAGEVAVAEAKYPLGNGQADRCFATGRPLGAESVASLSGGRVFRFETRPVLDEFNRAIARLDTHPGPHSGSNVVFLASPAAGAGGFDFAGAVARVKQQASAWTETKKRVFMIRAD